MIQDNTMQAAQQFTINDGTPYYLDPGRIVLPTGPMTVRQWWDRFFPGCVDDMESPETTLEGEAAALLIICEARGIIYIPAASDGSLATTIAFPWWLMFQYYSNE